MTISFQFHGTREGLSEANPERGIGIEIETETETGIGTEIEIKIEREIETEIETETGRGLGTERNARGVTDGPTLHDAIVAALVFETDETKADLGLSVMERVLGIKEMTVAKEAALAPDMITTNEADLGGENLIGLAPSLTSVREANHGP